MSTYMANANTIEAKWHVINADGLILGRLVTQVAMRLRGKHKPEYTPHLDTGDFVIVVNAAKVKVTGNKIDNKLYYHHSGYIGGLKTHSFAELQEKHPTRVIELAVKGMLPKGPLGRQMFRKLKVYAGADHPHHAQQPELWVM